MSSAIYEKLGRAVAAKWAATAEFAAKKPAAGAKKKNCKSTSISCGFSCISGKKVCRLTMTMEQQKAYKALKKELRAGKKPIDKLPADGSKKPIDKLPAVDVDALKAELGFPEPTAKLVTVNARSSVSISDFDTYENYYAARNKQRRLENELERTSLNMNSAVILPSALGLKDIDKISKLIKALPNGTPVTLPENSLELSQKLGIRPQLFPSDPYDPYDTKNDRVAVSTGIVENGQLREFTRLETRDIARIREIRYEIPNVLTRTHYSGLGMPAKLGKDKLAIVHDKEDKLHEELDEIENRHLGRKPTGKAGDYASYEKKSAAWAKAKFGDFNEGANGFSLEQTKAHDIAHPITHELTGLDSDAIHKKLGSLKDAKGNDALYGEEAIVNVMEQLSRGSSLEASILNGVRLARTMTRPDSDTGILPSSKDAALYVRSPKFVKDLTEIAEKAYRNNDFVPLIAHVRKSNRISGTVTAAGDDFNNSATGG